MAANTICNSLDISPLEGEIVDERDTIHLENVEMDADTDIQYARDNLYELIEKSKDIFDDMSIMVKQAQDPRAYEVLNNVIKNMSDLNKSLIDLHKKKKDISPKTSKNSDVNSQDPTVVNNNLFVGSTAELLKMIEEKKNER